MVEWEPRPRKKLPPELTPEEMEALESLKEQLQEETLVERHVAAYQTREAPIRDAEDSDLTRGEVFRFERGQIYKAYKILRKQIREAEAREEDATAKRDLLQRIRERARTLERDLDRLERQYHENVRMVEIETPYGKFSVPVIELDLQEPDSEEVDERTPHVLLGSVAANYHQTAALSMGLALAGAKVYVLPWPEQAMVGRPENFGQLLEQQQDLGLHTAFAKEVINQMGLGSVNVVGVSMGAAVALTLAQDSDFQERLQDLTVIEPVGLQKKSLRRLGQDFLVSEGLLKTFPYSEARIKTLAQGSKTNTSSFAFLKANGRILSNTHFGAEALGKIQPKGRYQIWMGTKSSIVDSTAAEGLILEAEALRQQVDADASPVEVHVVQGGTHGWPFLSSVGFATLLLAEDSSPEQVTEVSLRDLANSSVAQLLKGLE